LRQDPFEIGEERWIVQRPLRSLLQCISIKSQ
jgi:hypothetical protein